MTLSTFRPIRILLWIILIAGGFFAGVAWKNAEGEGSDRKESDTLLVSADTMSSVKTTTPEGGRAIAPRRDLTRSELATINLFEEASNSVCFITTTRVQYDYFSFRPTEIPAGTGSGFVWDKEGHIITNYHVIRGANRAIVNLANGENYEATVIGQAPEKDLAVLKIDAPRKVLRPIPIGTSNDLLVGQSVYAIGNPFGLDQTLTTGIVSALGREIESVAGIPIKDVIQTDAAINPGNSGGPLLDSGGRLIGVNTAIYSPSGASAGIGFSIPVDVVNWVVPELIKYGEIKRPTLGIQPANPRYANQLGIEGVIVLKVFDNTGAAKAGIQPTRMDRQGKIYLGDIITKIGKYDIKSFNDLILTLEKFKPGETVDVTILRDSEELTLPVELGSS